MPHLWIFLGLLMVGLVASAYGVRVCSLFCLAVSGADCYHNSMSVQPSVLCKQDRNALVVPSNK